jgi:hypothetical protein
MGKPTGVVASGLGPGGWFESRRISSPGLTATGVARLAVKKDSMVLRLTEGKDSGRSHYSDSMKVEDEMPAIE